jgi:hypothetical protein
MITALLPQGATAFVYQEDFNNSDLNELILQCPPGFTFLIENQRGYVEKSAGISYGILRLTTTFCLIGDFTATIKVGRLDLSGMAELGINCNFADITANDIFFADMSSIYANLFQPPGFGTRTASNSASEATFRLRRDGSTLFIEYDTGYGFQILHQGTHENLAGPTSITLFLVQEFGYTNFHQGFFDDFRIIADDAVQCATVPVFEHSWGAIKSLYAN